jgi:hypothetical protein
LEDDTACLVRNRVSRHHHHERYIVPIQKSQLVRMKNGKKPIRYGDIYGTETICDL